MVGHGFLYCTTLNSVELDMVCECAAHLKKKKLITGGNCGADEWRL